MTLNVFLWRERLSCVQDDNITYIAWAAWESAEDLIDYIKSDAARKVIEYISKEDIVALISGVRPIV